MPLVVLVLIVLLYVGPCRAASLDDVPFLGSKHPFNLQLVGNTPLAAELKQQLKRERAENAELRQLTEPESIARYEANILTSQLRAKGYYAAEVQWQLGKRIEYQVLPGALYVISELALDLPSVNPVFELRTLGIHQGMPLAAGLVLAAQARIEAHYQTHSCLYRVRVNYEARINHSTHQASLRFWLEPSEPARFGTVQFVGADSIHPEHLMNYLNFSPGDCFHRQQLDASRLELLQSGLLASVSVEALPPHEGRSDLVFHVLERRARTLKGGLSYDADAGEGVALGWEHRNLFGQGEKLALTGDVSQLARKLDSQITLPHFLVKAQNLVLHAKLEHETPAAFRANKADFGITLNRRYTPFLTLGLGVQSLLSQVESNAKTEDFGLLGVPLSVDINHRDDLLDPRKGWNLGAKTEFFWNVQDVGSQFQKTTFAASLYRTAGDWHYRPTLAVRASAGSISGEALTAIPAPERFYVGGGGSVRGYSYQSLGTLTQKIPDGGLSFGETSAELRLRLTPTWGAVIFVDGGLAYGTQMPSWGDGFLWGAGLGLRYYTSFAPIRFDIASPLNRRQSIDDPVQLYISIGQAF